MKKIIIFLTLILAVIFVAAFAISKKAHAVEWNKWNIAPYATSQGEACKKAQAAVKGFNMPETVKEHFVKVLGTTCKGSTEVWLTPHQPLEQMWSGGQKPHVMDKITVGELPVLKSPDGRPYRKDAVAETAKAQSWSFVHDGKMYVLYLPSVCFNWSWAFAPAPETPKKESDKPLAGSCPDVYFLKVNVWERNAMKLQGVEQTHAKEELGEKKFASIPRVSRMHGGQFRRASASGQLKRSSTTHVFRVSFIMTPEAQGEAYTIAKEEVLGDINVKGLHELQFAAAQLAEWDAIRVVAINGGVVSPPRNSTTGFHELRFFNRLPNKKLGEWDDNPVPDCIMNQHWIE